MKEADRRTFTTQLSVLIGAGIPLSKALSMIANGLNQRSAQWVMNLINEINQGKALSWALRESKQNFDSYYCGMIEVGEESGKLSEMLKLISSNLESSERLKAKIRKALAYPSAVLFIAMMIIIGMLIWVIPTFETVFTSFNSTLPTPTLIVLYISKFVREYLIFFVLTLLVTLFFFLFLWQYSPSFQKWLDRNILKIPFIGKLSKSALISKWFLTIESLQQSGTPLLKAIRISARCSNQWSIHESSVQIHQLLSCGSSLHQSALISNKNCSLFDSTTLELIKAGEESGTLNEMLRYLSKYHEKQVDNAVDILMELLEPVLVCFLGLTVGGMVIALYLPLFKIGQLA